MIVVIFNRKDETQLPNLWKLFRKSVIIAAHHQYTQSLLKTRPYSAITLQLFQPTLFGINLHSAATYIAHE